MAEFDDIFSGTSNTKEDTPKEPFNVDEWKKHKSEQREAAFSMIEDATAEVVNNANSFKSLLGVMASFDRYTVNNALLVYKQKPNATLLRDSDKWREDGIYVKKNEKGIIILTPGNEYVKDDGTTATGVNTKTVFDVSQVDTAADKSTKHYDDRAIIKSLYRNAVVPVAISDNLADGVNAFYDHKQNTIYVRAGMEASEIVTGLSQEMAHALYAQSDKSYERSDYAFDAYCAAFIVSSRFGYDVTKFDFSHAPKMFENLDPQQARQALGAIKSAASDMVGKTIRDIEPQKNAKSQTER